jgi:hypothetical protein
MLKSLVLSLEVAVQKRLLTLSKFFKELLDTLRRHNLIAWVRFYELLELSLEVLCQSNNIHLLFWGNCTQMACDHTVQCWCFFLDHLCGRLWNDFTF